jgi:uncharacterized protein YodC (DUF2158 family)
MNETFKIGDTVELKSGGPKMTVAGPAFYGNALVCQWFDGTKLSSGEFPPSSLKPADTDR